MSEGKKTGGMKITVTDDGIESHELTVLRGDVKLMEYENAMANVAKYRKIKFDAHIREGFTEAQALELCKEML